MTRERFINAYCERSGILVEVFSQSYVALPCDCGDSECEGWAKVRNDAVSMLEHFGFRQEAIALEQLGAKN
jgi:hypothetical protein